MHESAYSTIPNSNPSTKAFAEAEMTFRSTCVEIKIYGAFVLNQRVVLHAIDAHPTHWLIYTQRSTDTVVQTLPVIFSLNVHSTRVAALVAECGSKMRTL